MDELSGERAGSQPAQLKRKGQRKNSTERKPQPKPDWTSGEETGQRTVSDFGIKRQKVQVVGDVQWHDDGFEAPREEQTNYVFCFYSCETP